MSFAPRKILCAVDFSSNMRSALQAALSFAKSYGASIELVHVYTIPAIPHGEAGVVFVDEDRLSAAVKRQLDELAGQHSSEARIDTHAVPGWPGQGILHRTRASNADLIVIGTRGLTGLPRFLLGSVAERVIRTSPVPVLVVPESIDESASRLTSVLCGVDFSPASTTALRTGVSIAQKHGAHLHVLHGWEPSSGFSKHSELMKAHEQELEDELAAHVSSEVPADVQASQCVRRGPPYAAVVDEAQDVGADLIVMGNVGKSGLSHLLLGSVTERVLRVSTVPVLVVRGE